MAEGRGNSDCPFALDIPRCPDFGRPYPSASFFRDVLPIVGLLVLLTPASASAQRLSA